MARHWSNRINRNPATGGRAANRNGMFQIDSLPASAGLALHLHFRFGKPNGGAY